MSDLPLDLLIVGAGPAGLATAIAARQRGWRYLVIDKGGLVDGIRRFPTHMVFFTTPELLEIGGLPFVTPYEKPTRHEALRYYRRVADTFDLALAFDEQVAAVHASSPDAGTPLFSVTTRTAPRRVPHAHGARRRLRHRLLRPSEPDWRARRGPAARRRTTTPTRTWATAATSSWWAGKNSAAEAALELYRAGARVTLVHREAALGDSIKYWVKPDIENRIAEGCDPRPVPRPSVRAISAAAIEVDGPSGPRDHCRRTSCS